jgi:cold shock CspA family protein
MFSLRSCSFRGFLRSFSVAAENSSGDKTRQRGICKWFSVVKGFGYITPEDGSTDVFVHQSELHAPGFRSLSEGAVVEFDVEYNESLGKYRVYP